MCPPMKYLKLIPEVNRHVGKLASIQEVNLFVIHKEGFVEIPYLLENAIVNQEDTAKQQFNLIVSVPLFARLR